MKRKNNLYNNLLKMENIEQAYNEVCSHTRNKRKVRNYKEYRCIYISRIYKIGVRIDIWTHFMRGCIIDYVH